LAWSLFFLLSMMEITTKAIIISHSIWHHPILCLIQDW
jgi:hypothetical protein